MDITICPDKAALGATAARDGAAKILEAVADRGSADIIVATGASQFEMLEALAATPDLPWEKVAVFHLDEYVGLPVTHPASFRRYLWERFHRKLPRPVRAFHYLDAESDPERECARASALISSVAVDVAFIGIGENGHVAFNDPPADFETESPYLIVKLDDACRRQQLGEGWFPTFDDVPDRAVSMSVKQILKSRHIVCTVPDERKAEAVRNAVRGPVTPGVPASALQRHPSCHLYLDPPAASKLDL
jgi:glucosamine-6-phosphate deaminase